jgi:hypothetical protein
MTPGDSLVPVRTSESCLATTAKRVDAAFGNASS